MTILTDLFLSTNWGFVVLMTIISLILGMLRYSRSVFGNLYGRWMNFDMTATQSQKGMLLPLIGEALSKLLYFTGIALIFAMMGTQDLSITMSTVLMLWLFCVFSTQLSQISRAMVDRRVLLLLAGKTLLDTIVAALLRYILW